MKLKLTKINTSLFLTVLNWTEEQEISEEILDLDGYVYENLIENLKSVLYALEEHNKNLR